MTGCYRRSRINVHGSRGWRPGNAELAVADRIGCDLLYITVIEGGYLKIQITALASISHRGELKVCKLYTGTCRACLGISSSHRDDTVVIVRCDRTEITIGYIVKLKHCRVVCDRHRCRAYACSIIRVDHDPEGLLLTGCYRRSRIDVNCCSCGCCGWHENADG